MLDKIKGTFRIHMICYSPQERGVICSELVEGFGSLQRRQTRRRPASEPGRESVMEKRPALIPSGSLRGM